MQVLPIPEAEVYYDEHFLTDAEATALFDVLLRRRPRGASPALTPDESCDSHDHEDEEHRHSGPTLTQYQPLSWIPELLALKRRVEEATPLSAYANLNSPKLGYNAALCNLYRDGNDSVGLHADAEPEMGPVIASVSLGAERLFRIKRHDGSVVFAERLPNGSLLIMAGKTQLKFKHEAPKEPGITRPRINLTFRHIEHN